MMAGVVAWGSAFAAPEMDKLEAAVPDEAPSPVELVVDLSDRQLTVRDAEGGTLRTYDVAVGAAAHPTPTGTYSVSRIIWNPRWVPPPRDWAKDAKPAAPGSERNPMQVAKIFFREPWYYIHGTNAPESMGSAASKGCVRMRPEDVRDLALLLMQETGHHLGESWVAGVLAGSRSEEIELPQTVTMTIRP